MAEPTLKDKTYSIIMKRFVETGQAPHYTEIAAELGVSPKEGRQRCTSSFRLAVLPAGSFRRATPWSLLRPSTTSLPSTESPSTGNRSGSPSELSNRWRSAGSFPVRRYKSTPCASIAMNPYRSR